MLRTYLRVLCTRPVTRLTCGPTKCGFAPLKARVVFGDTSHRPLVWARAGAQARISARSGEERFSAKSGNACGKQARSRENSGINVARNPSLIQLSSPDKGKNG